MKVTTSPAAADRACSDDDMPVCGVVCGVCGGCVRVCVECVGCVRWVRGVCAWYGVVCTARHTTPHHTTLYYTTPRRT